MHNLGYNRTYSNSVATEQSSIGVYGYIYLFKNVWLNTFKACIAAGWLTRRLFWF